MDTTERLKMIKGALIYRSVMMDGKDIGKADLQRIYDDMQWLIEKVEGCERLDNRFKELDVAIQGLQDVFTPQEQERHDIRYSHMGIVNGAVRAINYLRVNPTERTENNDVTRKKN